MATIHTARIKADRAGRASIDNIAAGVWKGRAARLQVGLFESGAPASIGNIESVTLVVKASRESVDAALMSATVAAASLVQVTSAQWLAGTHQTAEFEFTNAETNLTVSGDKAEFWMAITAVLDSGDLVTYGHGKLVVYNDNADAVGDPPENPDPALTIVQGDARYVRGSVVGNKLVLSTGHFIYLNEPES